MEEQRKLERFALKIAATIRVVQNDPDYEKRIQNSLTRDISAGGAFFYTKRPLPKGTVVTADLILDLKGIGDSGNRRTLVRFKGTVLRIEPTGMAIQFGKENRMIPLFGT